MTRGGIEPEGDVTILVRLFSLHPGALGRGIATSEEEEEEDLQRTMDWTG